MRIHLSLLLVCLYICLARSSIITGGVDVPISTVPSALPKCACGATPGPLFQGLKPPFPTDSWWIGLGVPTQTASASGPFPYLAQALNQGLYFGLPTHRYFDGTSIHMDPELDWFVGATEIPNNINNHKATGWDEVSVTVQWFSGASTLTTPLVQGSAYMTFIYKSATPNLVVQNGDTLATINGQAVTSASITASKFKIVLNTGSTWLVYSLNGAITLNPTTKNTLVATSAFNGVIRIARLNDTSGPAEQAFDTYYASYATGAALTYTVADSGDIYLYFNWQVTGNANNLLQMSWPHHRKVLVSPNTVSQVQFLTIKGYQIGILGGMWTLHYVLTPNINWFAPRSPDASCLPQLEKFLEYEIKNVVAPVPNDMYFWGVAFARVARLGLIAQQIGRTDLVPTIVAALKQSFDPWFTGTGGDPAGFETGWGGVCSISGTNNSGVDFGNGYYNDHHFHYGYHLYGAAVIGYFDPSWLTEPGHTAYLDGLARDIGNPSSLDPDYTISRHKDWFAGHSWASGIANGAGDRDQESSTEAINSYYGLYLYSLVSNHTNLQKFARLCLVTEIVSVQSYWHLYPSVQTDTPYPEVAFRDLTTVGNVMEVQAGAWLFWGSRNIWPSQVASIEILPVTPISEIVIDSGWAASMWPYVAENIADQTTNVTDDWRSVLYCAHSVIDPYQAYIESTELTSWGSGNSASNTLYFISTRPKTSSNPICAGSPNVLNETTAIISSKLTGEYLYAGAPDYTVMANAQQAKASLWNLVWFPGGYSIQSNSSSLFMSSSNTGTDPVVANRQTASAWEDFTFTKQASGYYTITAASNGLMLCVQAGGAEIVGNAKTISDCALFSLTNAV